LDVGAQKLRRAVARRADQMEVARMPVGRLEPRAPFAEVDLARDAGIDHPLQRAVHGRASDARMLAPDEIEKVVRADMRLLAQEHVDDAIAFSGMLSARRPNRRNARGGWSRH